MILRRKRGCCDDNFSTLSLKVRWLTIIIMAITLVVAALVLLYLFAFEKVILKRSEEGGKESAAPLTSEDDDERSWSPKCHYSKHLSDRFDCYPENNSVTADLCEDRGCCWSGNGDSPRCFYPENYGYERTSAVQQYFDGLEVSLRRLPMPTRYGDDIQNIRIRAEFQSTYRLRVKFYDPEDSRYEVPEPKIHVVMPDPNDPVQDNIQMYSIVYNTTTRPFHMQIRRTNSDTLIFDTSVGGLTLANQFLQLSTKVASRNLYGLGDDSSQFKMDLNRKKWTLFSRSYFHQQPVVGVHPFYLCIEDDGKAHGVLLLNSNSLEIETQETPAVTFRALGGLLDFYFLLGPTPEAVVHQYLESFYNQATGYSSMPPYWALGLHTAITDYGSIDEIRRLVKEMRSGNIPRDSIHLGTEFLINHTMIPAIDELDAENIRQLQKEIFSSGLKVTMTFGPGFPTDQTRNLPHPMYDFALHKGLCVNNTWSELLRGRLWSNSYVYLDYGNPLTIHWLQELTEENGIIFQYDGVWLEMDVPVNYVNGSTSGCSQSNLNKPPYVPSALGGTLYKNTLCMDAKHWWGDIQYSHYNLHNLYGLSMARAYHSAQKKRNRHRRPVIISSSTFVGSGQYSGHMLAIGKGTWTDLSRTVARALRYSLYGIPLTGVDACTFEENDEELCLRWLQLGAFLPLFYSSSFHTIVSMPKTSEEFNHALLHLVNRRYELLPYLYTLFHKAHTAGETVIRPLLHEFSEDNTTYDINTQFLWGPALLISPVLGKEVEYFDVYVPKDVWFDYDTGKTLESNGSWQTVNTSLYGNGTDSMPLFVRGGYVIPTQEPSSNTISSRKRPMTLIIALNREEEASGELVWDDGDGEVPDVHKVGEYVHVKILARNGKLTISPHLGNRVFSSDFDNVHIESFKILGLIQKPTSVSINRDYYLTEKQLYWDEDHKVLYLQNMGIPLTWPGTVIRWF